MSRPRLTDEERAAKRMANLEKARVKRAEIAAEREKIKALIRTEIAALASVIPPPYPRRRCSYGAHLEGCLRRGDTCSADAQRIHRTT